MVNVILPSGKKQETTMQKTVAQVLQDIAGSKASDSALVFYGEKLADNVRLADVSQLKDSSNVYLIGGNDEQEPTISAEEIGKEVDKYKKMIDKMSPENERKMTEYFANAENFKKLLSENPALYSDQLAFDLLCDYRLLTEHLFKKENFAHEHPWCLTIFKQAVEAVTAVRPSLSNNIFGQPIAGQQQQGGVAPITHDMLQQAMASVLNGFAIPPAQQGNDTPSSSGSDTGTGSSNENPPPNEQMEQGGPMEVDYNHLRGLYEAQLEQMREFGFIDDEENLRALQACDGNVEAALELVISMRE